jgi:hypothetical protein
MTVLELTETVLTDPQKLFDPKYIGGEVYAITIYLNEIRIQATYSGELVRELPQHLLQEAQMELSTGYTEMSTITTVSTTPNGSDCYKLTIVLT